MPLTIEHQILTANGWKNYSEIQRIKPGSDGKPIGENEKLVSLNINNLTISTEQFVGEFYLSKMDRVMYNIKNDSIDTLIEEDTKLPYKFDLNDSIKIDTLVKIIYNMTLNNIDDFYLIKDTTNLTYIKINKNELIRQIINTDIYSFITTNQTFYVRKNNLDYWISY